MENIQYYQGNEEIANEIGLLWSKLNRIHGENSTYFSEFFNGNTIEGKINGIFEDANRGEVNIFIAINDKNEKIGYCVSKVIESQGEIDSIYLLDEYRGQGIGEELMERSLQWMEEKKPEKIKLQVAVGNERVLKFYNKMGFYPRLLELERIKK